MIPWVLAGSASALEPCATLARLNERWPVPAPPVAAFGPPTSRDPYDLPNHLPTEHFVVHWGEGGTLSEAEVAPLAEALERAWDVLVDDLGHPAPPTSEVFLFNVYIGDTGGPSGYGAAGYYTVDSDGYPMIVVALASIAFGQDYADHAAQHELYHALQGVTNRFAYDGASAWFWEATAEWAAIEIDPANPYNGPFVYAYLVLPTYPVNFFDYPDSGVLQEYYQYGAFLFPHALTETHGPALIRDTWADPGDEPDPLEVMRARLAEDGADLDALWLDHLARNVVFDYAAGEVYRENVETWAPGQPTARRITAEVRGAGGDGLVDGARIQRYGAANLRLTDPDPGTLEIRLTGAAAGSLGSPARYGARVVRDYGDDTPVYEVVPFDGVTGALDLRGVGEEAEIWVTVGAWTEDLDPNRWTEEVFPLAWSLVVVPPDDAPESQGGVVPEDPPSCGCRSSGWTGAGLGLVLLLVTSRRRTDHRWG